MSVDEAVDERAPSAPGPAARPDHRWLDRAAPVAYLLLSVFVLARLWADPNGRVLRHNIDDHGVFLFFVAHAERVVFHLDNPFFTHQLNAPDGVNMMANTSILALALPVAPVTHWLGAGVAVALLLTLGLFGTAWAWYHVLSRHLVRSRVAAAVGGLWCGFAPTMVSHANGHVNFVAQFVVPFIVWRVLRLREPGRALRNGLALAALIVLQIFINEEILLFTALALGVFVIGYALWDRAAARAVAKPFLAGLGVAAAASSAVLAYPLWLQFFGPGSYHGQPFPPDEYVTDLLSYGAFARQSVAGTEGVAKQLSVSATEDNSFFGVPVLIMLVVAMVLLWRSAAAKATALAGLVLALMGLGPSLQVAGRDTGIPLPFALISHVPIIDLVSVTRFTMVSATVAGLLLALAADRAGTLGRRRRVVFWVALAVALAPVAPKPLPAEPAAPPPAFLAEGLWRQYVPAGRSLVPVPLPEVTNGRDTMRWAGLTLLDVPVPRGYFMGPVAPPGDDTGSWAAPRRPTSDLLRRVLLTGQVPPVDDADRRAAAADLAFWNAGAVALVETPNRAALETTLTALLGRAPEPVGGVLLWRVP
ncbi:hypothetical protein [Spirilliplanes yamanashiensis]|uniref:Glycosyl transferase n=1 Tax=Spirilliplanes yamanashiensis TaxID=42233 RepID=A0A8J3Y8J6_9ACTN|nr:hypothetical protein [Spirilliplanes yamanashiensis]MDP9817065.1 hypothetical protein [Spirilliplanes yamanashiensis]GIJ03279.1 glycosyl transferase [Spirilliplanes yamanashiensis]